MSFSEKTGKHVPAKPKRPAARARTHHGPAKAAKMAARKVRGNVPITALSIRRSAQTGPHADIFWAYVNQIEQMTESDRIVAIRNGLSMTLPAGLRDALDIQLSAVAKLLNTSTSTLERRMKSAEPLDLVASERLDRIAQITSMAEDVLESREEAAKWLTRAHPALNQELPISLCDTEIGARQVRRILSAIEWGNAA